MCEALGSVPSRTTHTEYDGMHLLSQDLAIEAEGSGFQGHSWLNSELRPLNILDSIVSEILCQKTKQKHTVLIEDSMAERKEGGGERKRERQI